MTTNYPWRCGHCGRNLTKEHLVKPDWHDNQRGLSTKDKQETRDRMIDLLLFECPKCKKKTAFDKSINSFKNTHVIG